MNKIHELELTKSEHINAINKISDVLKNQEYEKTLLKNKYDQEIDIAKSDNEYKNK